MKKIKLQLALPVILSVPCMGLAETALLIVDANELRDSNIVSETLCDQISNCTASGTYFIYRAKIKRNLNGALLSGEVILAHGQHTAYTSKNIDNWMVLVQKIDDSNLEKKLGAQYVVEQSAFEEVSYCFDEKPEKNFDQLFVDRQVNSTGDLFCYSLNDLRTNQ